jgi:hypothetical protein
MDQVIIAGRLLSVLQVMVVWPFKAKLKEQYIQWMALREHKFTLMTKIKLQETERLGILPTLVGRSFKKCGIPNELDGMEDNCLWDTNPNHTSLTKMTKAVKKNNCKVYFILILHSFMSDLRK